MIENIVLTEDDIDDISFFKLALKEIGYQPIPWITNSCNELFNIIDDMMNLPEIIFLDLNMPCINGFECLKKIRNISLLDNCKVIILTTSKAIEDIEMCRDLGADLFITKPSDISSLASILKLLLMTDYLNGDVISFLQSNKIEDI